MLIFSTSLAENRKATESFRSKSSKNGAKDTITSQIWDPIVLPYADTPSYFST